MLIQLKFTKGSAEQIIYFFIEVRDFRKVGNHWVKAPTYGPSLCSFVGKCQRQKLGQTNLLCNVGGQATKCEQVCLIVFEKCPDTDRSGWLEVHENSGKLSKELLGEKESMRPKALRKVEIVL